VGGSRDELFRKHPTTALRSCSLFSQTEVPSLTKIYLIFGVAHLDSVLSTDSGDGFHSSVDDVEDSAGGDGGEESERIEAEGGPEDLLSGVQFVSFFQNEIGLEGYVER